MDTIAEPKIQVVYHDDTDVKRDVIQSEMMLVTMPAVSGVVANAWSGEAGEPDSRVVGHSVRLHIMLDPEEYGTLPLPEQVDEDGGSMKMLSVKPSHNGVNGSRFVQIAFSRVMSDEEYETMLEKQREDGDVLGLMIAEMAEEIAKELAEKKEEAK
jgi:hypothetical protein